MLEVMISANLVLNFFNLDDCLFCEGCYKWVHIKSSKVKTNKFSEIRKMIYPFM